MSLEAPTYFERFLAVVLSRNGLIVIALAVVLLGSALYLVQCGTTGWFNHGVKKDKEAIANQLNEISNLKTGLANDQTKKTEILMNVNADTQELMKNANAREEAREETNRALANLAQAVNANRDVDRSAEDLQRILDKLNEKP